MYVYYISKFPEKFPKELNAIVVANSRLEAFALLARKLDKYYNLTLEYENVNPNDFIQLDDQHSHAVVFLNGS